jgi:hypothetical protein
MKISTSLCFLVVVGAGAAVAAADQPRGAAGERAPSPPPAAEAGAGAGKVSGPPKPWKDMTGPERGKYMKEVVTPKMKTAFQQFDKEEFGKFGCDTCHGKQAKARKFKMPNPDIYALPSTPAGFAPLMEKKPQMLKFMGEVVKPQMAALLGLPEYDHTKPEAGGFGCMACHTTKKE